MLFKLLRFQCNVFYIWFSWNFPESQSKYLDEEFGRVGFPKFPVEERASIAGNVYEKFKGMLPVIGITSTTGPGSFYYRTKNIFILYIYSI